MTITSELSPKPKLQTHNPNPKLRQACEGLPESGVADDRVWLALLGPNAVPGDVVNHKKNFAYALKR